MGTVVLYVSPTVYSHNWEENPVYDKFLANVCWMNAAISVHLFLALCSVLLTLLWSDYCKIFQNL